jgi:hypothetical protein
MRKQYLIDALSKLTPEEALEVVTRSQESRQTKREIPTAKIEALRTMHDKLTETTKIQFPVRLEGQVKLTVDWDGSSCYLNGAELVLDSHAEHLNGDYFKDLLADGENADYSSVAKQQLEKLENKGNILFSKIEELAAEYDADLEELAEKITGDVTPRRYLRGRKRKNPRRRRR